MRFRRFRSHSRTVSWLGLSVPSFFSCIMVETEFFHQSFASPSSPSFFPFNPSHRAQFDRHWSSLLEASTCWAWPHSLSHSSRIQTIKNDVNALPITRSRRKKSKEEERVARTEEDCIPEGEAWITFRRSRLQGTTTPLLTGRRDYISVLHRFYSLFLNKRFASNFKLWRTDTWCGWGV